MARFAGKVFLISGGARGLGAAQARQLVAQGAKVVVGDLLEDAGQALAAELGPAAVFQRLDVTEATQWRAAVEAAERLGPLNGLVNNAGIFLPAPILEVDTAMFERHWRVNELGTFLGMQAVVPAFVRRHPGRPQRHPLQRQQVCRARHDQGGGHRAGRPQHPRQLRSPRHGRH